MLLRDAGAKIIDIIRRFGFKLVDAILQPFQHSFCRVVIEKHPCVDMAGDAADAVVSRHYFRAGRAVRLNGLFRVVREGVAFVIKTKLDFPMWIDAAPYAVGSMGMQSGICHIAVSDLVRIAFHKQFPRLSALDEGAGYITMTRADKGENMKEIKITSPPVNPVFDMEEFMNFSKENRLASSTVEKLVDLWEEWRPELKTAWIRHDGNAWLAIWLPEKVEQMIDDAWDSSPGEGFLKNSLAQYMCMAAVGEMLPQAADGGCAPAPKPDSALRRALGDLGLVDPAKNADTLLRRYAILTHYPFRGGCEICALQENCPKAHGSAETASVVLPGYERGIDD